MQIWDFGHPHRTGNVLLCWCKERYLLSMKCFIAFLRCVKMVKGAFDRMYEPLMIHNVSFLPTTNLKFDAKTSVFSYPLKKGSVMLCYNGRHPLVLNYFMPLLKYIRIVGRATGSLYESFMVHSMSFLPITNITFHANVRCWAPSQQSKWAAVLQGEVSIVDEVLHNLPEMYKDGWKSF